MELDDKRRRWYDGIIVGSTFFVLTFLSVAAFQLIFVREFSFMGLVGLPVASGVLFGLIAYANVGRHSEYEDVELTGILDNLTVFDGQQSFFVDFSDEPSIVLPEPVLSSVQGTPPPLLVAGSVVQERAPHSHPITPELQETIEWHVAQTIANLPPLPSRAPVIQRAIATETPSSDTPASIVPTPRETLEAKPLKEVIADLGNEGYIDALLYCLSLSENGSKEIILSARGPVHGLGARGLRKDDGITGFTRSDVLKMLRKARGAVSANLQSDIQTSGEGRS